jgi:hypothetical protein
MFGSSIEPKWQLNEKAGSEISDRIAFGGWNEESWGWGVMSISKERLDQKSMKVQGSSSMKDVL